METMLQQLTTILAVLAILQTGYLGVSTFLRALRMFGDQTVAVKKLWQHDSTKTKIDKEESVKTVNEIKLIYNIPRACLLNGSPVPAMDVKSNRSGLWPHMLETCRRLRRLCRKHSNNVARHDKTPVKSTFLSRDMSFMSRRSDIVLWLLYI